MVAIWSNSMSTKLTIWGITHGFISYMRDDEGCTESTLASYLNDLKVAHEFFGADTDVETLTPERVAEFFASDAVKNAVAAFTKNRPEVDAAIRAVIPEMRKKA